MTDVGPAVALLFDDTELGGQLREALHERGARIVHEGGVSSLSRELLQQLGAEVVVVNLDDAADDALDQLYELIEGDRPRVVFNDAQASRALVGWDRARWARHLAAKVLEVGDVDPPRPVDARSIDIASVESVQATPEVALVDDTPEAAELDVETTESAMATESENLAVELEALLASGELPADEDGQPGSGLRYAFDEDLSSLHDSHFGALSATSDSSSADRASSLGNDVGNAREKAPSVEHAEFQMDHAEFQFNHLQLTSVGGTYASAVLEPAPANSITTLVSAHESWALLGDEAPSYTIPGKSGAAAFGIEKMSAADFLAPNVEQVAPGAGPAMSLELVSMEVALAPQAYVHGGEMLLDDLGGALSRIVLLGATVEGVDSVCAFLKALPATTRLTFLHTQHLGEQPAAVLVEQLAASCALPVRLAEPGGRATAGEVLVVPAEQQVRLRRDGVIELQLNDANATQGPSIDASFTMAAGVFGRDALAIVFAGRANDAVAGAQAIHDRGGRVWVESSSGEHFADMVSGIFAERLVSFSGTPHELAAHLIEVFP
jgi:chemosensory pili system protein ChpB (putative protein-glutamate methylesterase)